MAETLRVRSSKRARPPIAGVFGLFMALNPLLAMLFVSYQSDIGTRFVVVFM